MKRTAKPVVSMTHMYKKPEADPLLSDISVGRLIDDGLLAIYREMRNLLLLSANGKLEAANARDLRDLVKLLFELKDREDALLKGLTDEQIKKIIDTPRQQPEEQDDHDSGE